MYGNNDYIVIKKMSRNLHRAYLDDGWYRLHKKHDNIYALNKAHQDFFMKDEPVAQSALMKFVEKLKQA